VDTSLKTFSPLSIKGIKVKNRLFMPAMGTLFGEPETNMVSDRMEAYIKARAKGGVGFIMVEYAAISPAARAASMELGIWDDRFIPGLKRLADIGHAYGTKIGIQLHHAGRSTTLDKSGFQPVAPTGIPNPMRGSEPRELAIEELPALCDAYAAAALRAKTAGYDCVEIHGAHGYLISQFMSPFSNHRRDAYGGSFENRMRFPLEVLEAVRSAVGKDFIISFRFSSEEYVEGGLTAADAVKIAQLLEANGVDIINVSQGILDAPEYILSSGWLSDGFNRKTAAEVKKHVKIPVVTVGQYHSPEIVEDVIAKGDADMVALGRALIADPEFPNKMADMRWNEIRKCLLCLNSCCNEPAGCTQNPLFGYEDIYPLRAAFKPLDVMVIGGGPAGLQAAVTAAERCHRVRLYEKGEVLGGQALLASRPPSKTSVKNIVEYREVRLNRLRVPIHTGCEVDIKDIRRCNPDVVILATGSKPVKPPIKGIENGVFAVDVLAGKADVGQNVVIIGGGSVGAETAHILIEQGRNVTIVEMLGDIAKDAPYGERIHLVKYLKEKAVIHTKTGITDICGRKLEAEREGEKLVIDDIDTFVIACGSRAYNPLEEQIKSALPGVKVIVIGDSRKARRFEQAIKEGFLAGYTL
jgi:2,4-dienoyl-CoA reductase-like NADH-dependent reductase (Old Yellow Enzyme family)/thioredoxin reductase